MGAEVRNVIVNADDFGLSSGVTRGIIRAHQEGILTSTSLMVRGAAATEAAGLARRSPALSVGLHADLAEWIFLQGEWRVKYQVVAADDRGAVAAELDRQLEAFRHLVGRNPTHLDSHQHLHRNEPVRSVFLEAADQLGVPLRECNDAVRFCGDFYGQTGEGNSFPEGITVANLLRILAELKPGWTEVSCHPGDDDMLDSTYKLERKAEMNVLCDPRVAAALDSLNVRLCSFHDLLCPNQKGEQG